MITWNSSSLVIKISILCSIVYHLARGKFGNNTFKIQILIRKSKNKSDRQILQKMHTKWFRILFQETRVTLKKKRRRRAKWLTILCVTWFKRHICKELCSSHGRWNFLVTKYIIYFKTIKKVKFAYVTSLTGYVITFRR